MRLFYRAYGEGVPLIMLHGLYASSDTWMGLVPALSRNFRLILVDLRNHGRSPHSMQMSYAEMSNDVLELMDVLELKSAYLVGHSMGGKVAMRFALDYPERVLGLAIEDISPLAYSVEHSNYWYHKTVVSAIQKLPLGQVRVRKDAEELLVAALGDVPMAKFLVKNLQQINGTWRWLLNIDALATGLANLMDGIAANGKKVVYKPAVFIKGADSAYIAPQDIPAISSIFPASKLVVVDGADHWVHIRQPQEFERILTNAFMC